MIDNKNNLLTVNDSAQNILGIQANANFFDIVGIFGENFNLGNVISEVISTKSPNLGKEIKANDRILNIFVNPVENNKVSVALHDITEDKKKELQKEDLIHIMVHELRAPTTTIKDSAELIITSEDSLGADKKLKFLEIIHTQAKRVLGQIGSILDTAKLDAGKLVLQKTKGDIAKLIKEEVQNFMPQAERKSISLNFNLLNDSLPLISFDEIRVSQAIDNLLSNSLKFTPEGGKIKVELDYKVIPPVVDGTSPMGEFLSLDKFIIVSVSDSGVGITPEQQKLLFSKYVQAKNTSEKVATMGTGLGLYLAKGIVEAHNGRIWVKSALGQGTTFSFTLPATDDSKSTYEAPRPTMTPLAKLSQTVN
jgi:signal transduction histidine kinase